MKDDTTAEKHPGTRKLPGCFHCTAVRCTSSASADIMPKAHHAEGHHLRSNIIYFTWLGCGCGGILVNSAFSTSGVATLDTTISRMTAVK